MLKQWGLVSHTGGKVSWVDDVLWAVVKKQPLQGVKCGEMITNGCYTRVPDDVVKHYCQMMNEQLADEYPDFVHSEESLELFICSADLSGV